MVKANVCIFRALARMNKQLKSIYSTLLQRQNSNTITTKWTLKKAELETRVATHNPLFFLCACPSVLKTSIINRVRGLGVQNIEECFNFNFIGGKILPL